MTEKRYAAETGGRVVLSRAGAERAIRQADPEEVARLAFAGGAAVLDLECGEVLARGGEGGEETCGPAEVPLWTVSCEDRSRFCWFLWSEDSRGNWLGDGEVRQALLRVREGMRYVLLDTEEYVPEALIDRMVDGYSVRASDRRAEQYVRSLRNDPDRLAAMPDAGDFLRVAREGLDRIYGTVPNGEEA